MHTPDLVRGVWGLSSLDALGAPELTTILPAIRAKMHEMDVHQLRALSRVLAAGVGGEGAVGDVDAVAVASELAERADQLAGS